MLHVYSLQKSRDLGVDGLQTILFADVLQNACTTRVRIGIYLIDLEKLGAVCRS